MADDINAARRAELLAQRAVLEPQIRGLHDDVLTIISDDLKAAFQHQIAVKERRRDLIDAEVAGMDSTNSQHDALLADGYPDLPTATLDTRLWEELQRENADRDAAASVFKSDQANSMSISLGQPEPKPAA